MTDASMLFNDVHSRVVFLKNTEHFFMVKLSLNGEAV